MKMTLKSWAELYSPVKILAMSRFFSHSGHCHVPSQQSLVWPHAQDELIKRQEISKPPIPSWSLQLGVGDKRFSGGSAGKRIHQQCRRCGFDPWVRNPLKEGTATHSSILAWRIPRTEEPGGLQSKGLQRVRHD